MMRLGRRDVAALAAVAAIVCGTVWFLRRIRTADDEARAAGIVQGEQRLLCAEPLLTSGQRSTWR